VYAACECLCVYSILIHPKVPKPSATQLFGGDEDEEDGDEEEDASRFDIRPQFEGRGGQKVRREREREGGGGRPVDVMFYSNANPCVCVCVCVCACVRVQLMELQSRFGTDERFRMDSRFLDEDKGEESGEAPPVT